MLVSLDISEFISGDVFAKAVTDPPNIKLHNDNEIILFECLNIKNTPNIFILENCILAILLLGLFNLKNG